MKLEHQAVAAVSLPGETEIAVRARLRLLTNGKLPARDAPMEALELRDPEAPLSREPRRLIRIALAWAVAGVGQDAQQTLGVILEEFGNRRFRRSPGVSLILTDGGEHQEEKRKTVWHTQAPNHWSQQVRRFGAKMDFALT